MGTTSLVHAIGVNKYTKRTQMRMSRILDGSCVLSKSIESIENVLESGARDLYCVITSELMRVKNFALSIIELWIFQLLDLANGNDISTLLRMH